MSKRTKRPPRRELVERVAHALAWWEHGPFDVAPRKAYERVNAIKRWEAVVNATGLLTALSKAGLVVTVRKRGKRG